MKKLTYIRADDWCGLYVNDVLNYQGHSLAPFHIMEAAGNDYFKLEQYDPGEEKIEFYLNDAMGFPATLTQLKRELEDE